MVKFEEVIREGVVLPDAPTTPTEGTRTEFEASSEVPAGPIVPVPAPASTFAERYARFRGCLPDDTPEDLASQHDHYRLGTPKR